ncbi:surface antigen S [Striga asiatica]|uniref:Surface antigen S n=1 Tax=Striga asiatica TaxID=4170 RepID=A0A5A7R4Z6_STRAF|nr:surface antigen S [Striga asiatica]
MGGSINPKGSMFGKVRRRSAILKPLSRSLLGDSTQPLCVIVDGIREKWYHMILKRTGRFKTDRNEFIDLDFKRKGGSKHIYLNNCVQKEAENERDYDSSSTNRVLRWLPLYFSNRRYCTFDKCSTVSLQDSLEPDPITASKVAFEAYNLAKYFKLRTDPKLYLICFTWSMNSSCFLPW